MLQHTRRATVVEGHGFRALRRSSTSTRRRVEEPRAEGGGCSDEIEGVEEMELKSTTIFPLNMSMDHVQTHLENKVKD